MLLPISLFFFYVFCKTLRTKVIFRIWLHQNKFGILECSSTIKFQKVCLKCLQFSLTFFVRSSLVGRWQGITDDCAMLYVKILIDNLLIQDEKDTLFKNLISTNNMMTTDYRPVQIHKCCQIHTTLPFFIFSYPFVFTFCPFMSILSIITDWWTEMIHFQPEDGLSLKLIHIQAFPNLHKNYFFATLHKSNFRM